jgi:hypothetical protein
MYIINIDTINCFRPPGIHGDWKYFLNTVGTALPMLPVQKLAEKIYNLPMDYDVIMSEEMPPEKETLQTHKFTMLS